MRKFALAFAAASLTLPVAMPAPAQAQGYYQGKTWRDNNGRLRCRRQNGTTGLIIGGAAGALAGRALDGGRNRTLGTIGGAAAGALLGREIDKSRGFRCR
jgi:outer membrane lipoprotein SlyB